MDSEHDRILGAIAVIVSRRRGAGCVLPFAQSIEVADELGMGAGRVEMLAREIPGIVIRRGFNYDLYEIVN